MTQQTPETVEHNNTMWWEKHSPDYPHHCTTPLDVTGKDFPLGPQQNPYGRFIYCPMPVSGNTRWGFGAKASLDRFLADVEAGTLPVASAVGYVAPRAAPAAPKPAPAPAAAPPAAEPDPFDLIGGGEPVAAPAPAKEPDPVPAAAAPEPEGEEETDEWGEVIKKPAAPDADPFAELL